MALDFSNRNSQDPNGIASLDTTGATEVWLKDNDWSQPYYDAASARKAGANNKVRMATAITNDGKKYNVILDANNQPISQIGDTTGQDDDQAKRWQQQQNTAAPPGGAPTRTINGQVFAWNPQTRAYDTPTGQIPVATPRTPEQQQIDAANAQSEQALNRERQWNSDHGYGWVTHAQRQEQVDKQQAQARADNNVARQTAAQEAANQLARDRLQFDKDKASLPDVKVADKPVNGITYTQVTKVTPQGETTIQYFGPDGQPVAALPREDKGTPAEPAGAPSHSAPYGAVSESLVRYRDFINQAVRDGRITPDQADRLMAARLADAKAQSDEQQGVVNTQTGIYGQNLTQRGQSLREVESRRNAANSIYTSVLGQFVPLLKYMPKGGGQAFLDLLSHGVGAAQLNAGAWGGLMPVPEIQLGPAAAAANAAPMPGTGGTFLAPYARPTAASTNAVANGVTATTAAAANPTGANVQAANDATMAGSDAAFGALGVGPGAAPTGQAPAAPAPIFAPAPPVNLPANPAAGSPGNDPTQPVGLIGPGAPVQGSFLSPYAQPRQGALQAMLADPDMPNHIVLQAFRDVYGYDPPGFAA